jgi:ribosomal protein S18 acetylase RimI-like enzyme
MPALSPSLEDLADLNLAQVARIHHRWQPAARLLEQDGLLCHQGTVPIPAPFQNCAMRTAATLSADETLDRAEAFFKGSANPFAFHTQGRRDADLEQALHARGYTRQSDLPAMLTEQAVTIPKLDPSWTLTLAASQADVEAFTHVCAQAYASLGLPSFLTPSYFVRQSDLLSPDVSIVIARDQDGNAAAAAMALHTGEMGGLYWVGTLPEGRGAGLAAACTAMATNLAFERGARAVTLQASHMGEAIYRRLGYREYGRTARWSR